MLVRLRAFFIFFFFFAENSQICQRSPSSQESPKDHHRRSRSRSSPRDRSHDHPQILHEQRSRQGSRSSQGKVQEKSLENRMKNDESKANSIVFNKGIKREIERLKAKLRKKRENKSNCVMTRLRLKKICRVPKDSKGKLPHFPLNFTN